ncbi:MAG TPA: flagellinolysin [Symbiobacteriaceae bacterium]|nr:flagellinolysin [Symbiobacteriaceae bacterium]
MMARPALGPDTLRGLLAPAAQMGVARTQALDLTAVGRPHATAVNPSGLGAPHGQRQQTAASFTRPDQFQASSAARSLNNILWSWRVLGTLLGRPQTQGPDLAGLQQALQDAQARVNQVRQNDEILNTLKSSALAGAEELVRWAYGLEGDGAPMTVKLEKEMGGSLASVSYLYDDQGKMKDMMLHINVSQFVPDTSSNGKNEHVIENDRIIAHEMTHAVMGRAMNIAMLPDWFMEGTAEYVGGGAERVSLSLQRMSPGGLLGRVLQPWYGDSPQYAASYLAVRYLDHATQAGGGIRKVMEHLQAGDSLDEAIWSVSGGRYEGEEDFLVSFARKGEGEAWMKRVDLSGRDPGSIRPAKSKDIVPDEGGVRQQPLRGFRITWPNPLEGIDLMGALSPGWGLLGAPNLGGMRQAAAAAYGRSQRNLSPVYRHA